MDDSIVDDVVSLLKQDIIKKFRETPINKRLIFLPNA